jgi:uncharacterized membrane protein YgdD (TMEM256/DUF423 family)
MPEVRRRILLAAALLGAAGVALGAFGAHGVASALDAKRLGWWETAAHYHMLHAVALLALGAAPLPRPGAPAALIASGTLVFSGTLYLMALGGPRWLGMVTPLGGMLLIAGWLLLAWRLFTLRSEG